MNCKRQSILTKRKVAVLHRNILLILLTVIAILLCVLIGSSIGSFSQSNAARQDSYKYYTSIEIQKGDTLWDIATEYMTSEYGNISEYVEELKEVNHLGDDAIHAGQYLTIPYFSEEVK